ncbi:MAG: RagB/SusD family nutrient uptake outer membrane protein [Cyclobacteriaceae bacterium]
MKIFNINTQKSALLILVVAIALTIGSCGEEFVTKEFTNGVTSESFFQNATHAEQALTAVYDILNGRGMYREGMWVLGDAPTDDINELTGDNGDYGTHYRAASDYRWEPSNPYSTARWYEAYKGIFRANILLEELPDIEMDAALKSRFEAEAKFLRGVFYFNLVLAFGDVPLVTTVLSREEYRELARTDQSVVYGQIEQDLLDAAAGLPATAPDPVGRATSGSANGLLSRIYLYQENWQAAVNAAEDVMDAGYDLVPSADFGDMFTGQLENSIESVFEQQSVGNSPNVWGGDLTENSFGFLWSPMIGWANWYSPSPGSYQQFEAGDIRRKASVLVVGAGDSLDSDGDGIEEPFPSGDMNTNYFNGGNVRKWLAIGTNLAQANNYEVNFPIVRYAEVLLNYAEAQNELGNSTDALLALNQIRARAQVADITETDQALLRDLIRAERRRELLYEGQRFYDIKRWGLVEDILVPLGFRVGTHEYWPVPLAELDLMPNLTQYPPN